MEGGGHQCADDHIPSYKVHDHASIGLTIRGLHLGIKKGPSHCQNTFHGSVDPVVGILWYYSGNAVVVVVENSCHYLGNSHPGLIFGDQLLVMNNLGIYHVRKNHLECNMGGGHKEGHVCKVGCMGNHGRKVDYWRACDHKNGHSGVHTSGIYPPKEYGMGQCHTFFGMQLALLQHHVGIGNDGMGGSLGR